MHMLLRETRLLHQTNDLIFLGEKNPMCHYALGQLIVYAHVRYSYVHAVYMCHTHLAIYQHNSTMNIKDYREEAIIIVKYAKNHMWHAMLM